ncbi:MAG: hypothetical protein Q8L64_02860 [bacterium]|nr:hypothetical protein [bacterium]
MSDEKQPRKASSVRHTRAIQRDHTKHPISAPSAEQIQESLTEIVHPATLAQVNYFRSLGLRERSLGLVVMVAFVLEMIWRQISGVNEMARMIQTRIRVVGNAAQGQSTGSFATLDEPALSSISEHLTVDLAAQAETLGRTKATFAARDCLGAGAL